MAFLGEHYALDVRTALFITLGFTCGAFLIVLARSFRSLAISLVSFVANFLDTLGIGSFATTASMARQFRLIPDEHLPATLNIGYVVPTVTQAYIYVRLVRVDVTTLVAMIIAATVGSWLGAAVVSSWPRRYVQIGMGLALIGAAVMMTLSQPQVGLLPGGGDALGLTGVKLTAGILGNFALGALMPMGIGLYAPCMILVYLLGMQPTAAFPIMMGLVRVPHAVGQYSVHSGGSVRSRCGHRHARRRHSRRPARRICCEESTTRCGSMAGSYRRRLHCHRSPGCSTPGA